MPQQTPKRSFLSYAGMATEMLVSILFGTFLGRWLDQKWSGKFPLYTFLGTFIGLFIALYRVFKSLQSDSKQHK